MYTDNAPELIKACRDLGYNHDKSTPYRHESNATCERCVRSIVEGARALLEKAGLPSCFWIFAVRHYCLMHNTRTPTNGESPWLRRFGEEFGGKRLPFGSLVNFLPKPETVKALPKFEPRGQAGILVGYRLHNGGKWTHDYLVFPVRYFDDYDYGRPRTLLELTPVTTQEVHPVMEDRFYRFPCRRAYDQYRNFPKGLLPSCIIPSFAEDACDVFEDKPDSESDDRAGGEASPNGDTQLEDPVSSTNTADASRGDVANVPPNPPDSDGRHQRQDKSGRWYWYDKYGNREFAKPLHGSLKPPSIPKESWRKLPKGAKLDIARTYRELEAARAAAKSAATPSALASSSTTTPVATATPNAKRPSSKHALDSILPMATLMLSVFGCMASGAADTQSFRNAVEDALQSLKDSAVDPQPGEEAMTASADGSAHSHLCCASSCSSLFCMCPSCHPATSTPTTCAVGVAQSVGEGDGAVVTPQPLSDPALGDYAGLPEMVEPNEDEHPVPVMPCSAHLGHLGTGHRPKLPHAHGLYQACVARPVKPAEVKTNEKAKTAMQDEWDRLRKVRRPDGTFGVWDESAVEEWSDVRKRFRALGKSVHVGLVFGIVVEKNHELDPKDKRRKYKGRAVFQGNNVRDAYGNWAIFADLGSSPATMEAARAADAYGLFPGHAIEQSDAEQAYTQAWLGGTPTYVRLPRDQWPEAWVKAGMTDPVCPLRLALYGHPDSGTEWEKHAHAHVTAQGFCPMDNWPSCYWHPEHKLFLVIYVDDFKMAGPKDKLHLGWDLIKRDSKTTTGLNIESPGPLGLFLGCKHEQSERVLPGTSTKVRVMEYNMEEFLQSCVDRYKELTGVQYMRKAETPFISEPSAPDFSDKSLPSEQEVAYVEAKLRTAAAAHEPRVSVDVGQVTPAPAAGSCGKGADSGGQSLKSYAAKVLMKVLYAARYARFDLLRAVCYLAQYITKWDSVCDKRLYRLMCYINSTYHLRLTGWVGDSPSEVAPHLFADADFAGDSKTSRSCSGVHLCLLGPNTVFPLAGQCKKQGCVSHSTPEAEVVAADHAMRAYGLPCLDLWDKLLGRSAVLQFHEDNETAIGAMRNGYSPALRHVKRTHGVCIRWLAERFANPLYHLFYERSALQAADIYTKGFTVPSEWDRVTRLINVLDPARFWYDAVKARPGHMPEEHKGGVIFGYRTPNPWHGRESLAIPDPDDPESAPVAACTLVDAAPPNPDAHVPWFVVAPCCKSRGVGQEVADRDHALGEWFGESPDYDQDDYASTADPGSDAEPFSEDEGDGAGAVAMPWPASDSSSPSPLTSSSTTPSTTIIASATTTTPDPAGHGSSLCVGEGRCSVYGGAVTPHPSSGHRPPRLARRIVEFCCHPNSVIGSRAPEECEVVRLTADDDLTTPGGLQKALDAVSVPGMPTLLFGSLPCTGGSPYQRMNWYRGATTRTKIRGHWRLFRCLWRSFRQVANACLANGGHIAIEWPKSCLYWRNRSVRADLTRWGCVPYHFDGCMYGLVSQSAGTRGVPLRKSWTICSNADGFKHVARACDHAHVHARIQGTDTKMTECYTPELADRIHYCWYCSA